jgi:hypothetical protein
MNELVNEFTKCLNTVSYCRAGLDYELPRDQRAKEDSDEKTALARAREIWRSNPSQQDALRAAFSVAQPLATIAEIAKP